MDLDEIGKDLASIEAVFRGLFFPSRFAVRERETGPLCRAVYAYSSSRCQSLAFGPHGLCWEHWCGWKGHEADYLRRGVCRHCGRGLFFAEPYEAHEVRSEICRGRKDFPRLHTVDGGN